MSNYYNEHDPKAAAWLRELIKAGLIPDGDVDERSITEINANELYPYTQCHFFAGIGGWSLALQLAGVPATTRLWTGSCPCQPFSIAGKGLAQADERHLWPTFFDLIKECKPDFVFGEQVASAIGHGWLDGVSSDLESENYACGAAVLGAHSVGAPHIRQRLYWVADSELCRRERIKVEQCTGILKTMDGKEESQFAISPHSASFRRLADSSSDSGVGRVGDSNSEQTDSTKQGQPLSSERLLRCWDSSRLVACRDGKTRRIPTEPLLQRVANGIPLAVDYLRDTVRKFETQITLYAKKTNRSTLETVREMQYAFWSEAIQWDVRGRIGLLSPEILLAALCQLERKLGEFLNRSSQSIIEAQRKILLNVRGNSANETTPCPPQRWAYAQQLTREFADSLHELPHEDALEAAQAIFDRAKGFPLTSKCPARTILLKGYGNAIVPQVAAEFIKAFISTLENTPTNE